MNALMIVAYWLVLLALIAMVTACATVVHGKSQTIDINAAPAGSVATVDGTLHVLTPAVVRLSRDSEHEIVIEREGFAPFHQHVSQELSLWILGNLIFSPLGAIIGGAVDLSTGAAWKLQTDTVIVTLRQTAPYGSAPACAVRPWPHWPTTQPHG